MALIYTALSFLLGLVAWWKTRKARRLEHKYATLANRVASLLGQSPKRPGNSPVNICDAAKEQYALGQLATERDAMQTRWERAHLSADCWRDARNWLTAVRSKKLPYLGGAFDVGGLMWALDRFDLWPYLTSERLLSVVQDGWALLHRI